MEGLKNIPASPKQTEEQEQLNKEIQNLTEQCRILNQVMKKGYMDTALFMENQNLLIHRMTECRRKKAYLLTKLKHRKEIVSTEQLIMLLDEQDGLLKEFDEDIFDKAVLNLRISKNHGITFCLKNGLELTEINTQEGGETECNGTHQ